ncbi:hypothetical protein KUTeg_017974 [Tegillarca granosa]|uniref:Uncharacterized protein n=1 Tax=Tegillarca granosa TaxID=220873 RepID=A0ABQ9EKI4_TEGGR|nr:hypothetical protein KUTeg_017974 [Tegillarca granosa]
MMRTPDTREEACQVKQIGIPLFHREAGPRNFFLNRENVSFIHLASYCANSLKTKQLHNIFDHIFIVLNKALTILFLMCVSKQVFFEMQMIFKIQIKNTKRYRSVVSNRQYF